VDPGGKLAIISTFKEDFKSWTLPERRKLGARPPGVDTNES
jgi:hypothetical protein